MYLYLLIGGANKDWRTREEIHEDWNQLLQERHVHLACRIMFEAVAQRTRCIQLELDI
jgi:hypothetical protein